MQNIETSPLRENRSRITHEALPLLALVNLCEGGAAQVPLDAPLAEGIGALVAADEVATVGAPAAVAVRPLLVLLPLALVFVEVLAAAAHRHAQVRMPQDVVLHVVIHLQERPNNNMPIISRNRGLIRRFHEFNTQLI